MKMASDPHGKSGGQRFATRLESESVGRYSLKNDLGDYFEAIERIYQDQIERSGIGRYQPFEQPPGGLHFIFTPPLRLAIQQKAHRWEGRLNFTEGLWSGGRCGGPHCQLSGRAKEMGLSGK